MYVGNKKLGVYVNSFDGCADLWDSFFMLVKNFWNDCIYSIYLVNNSKEYKYPGVNINIVHTGPEKNWVDRTARSLNMIDEEYVLFMLEDYFISKKIINDDIEEILSYMENNDVYYYQLSIGYPNDKRRIRVNAGTKKDYSISLQPAIWKRKKLLEVLSEVDGVSPWAVENYLNQKYKNSNDIPGAYRDTRDILGYKNGVLRGKWILDTIEYFKKQNINFDLGEREIMSRKASLRYDVANKFSGYLPETIKTFVKRIFKIIKYDYLR